MPVGNNQRGYESISIKPLHIDQPRLYFNSIITEYSDSWNPSWSSVNVYGRMDPVSTYAGTSREMVLGFRIVSDTSDEARENMLKIEKLIQYQYPSYQNGSGGTKIMNSPPYFEFTFLNLLNSNKTTGSKLTGYINGAVQVNPGFQAKEQAQFFNSSFTQLYFSDVTITLRLQVLHEGTIGWSNSSFSHRNYPYGIDAGTTSVAAPATPPEPSAPPVPGTQPPSANTTTPQQQPVPSQQSAPSAAPAPATPSPTKQSTTEYVAGEELRKEIGKRVNLEHKRIVASGERIPSAENSDILGPASTTDDFRMTPKTQRSAEQRMKDLGL